jgi:hypothetical protein
VKRLDHADRHQRALVQSMGADLSGQQGIGGHLAAAIEAWVAAFAGSESGRTRDLRQQIASNRPRWIEFHAPNLSRSVAMETSAGSLIRQNPEMDGSNH